MIRMIVAPLLVLATAAGAQECVYKSVMTDADLQACRNTPRTPVAKSKPAPTKAETDALIAQINADYSKRMQERQQQTAADAAADAAIPEAPVVGMTTGQAQAMLDANRRRNNKQWSNERVRWMGSCRDNKTTNAQGVHEQWVCGIDTIRGYMYFDNGILTSFQEQ
jgi:hypothetical protein